MSVNEVKNKISVLEFDVRGTGDPGSRTFAIGNEDHTLGNALRHVLMQNNEVEFAGYSVPHPVSNLSSYAIHLILRLCVLRMQRKCEMMYRLFMFQCYSVDCVPDDYKKSFMNPFIFEIRKM